MGIRRDSHKPLQSCGSAAGEPQNQFQMSLFPLLVGWDWGVLGGKLHVFFPFLTE